MTVRNTTRTAIAALTLVAGLGQTTVAMAQPTGPCGLLETVTLTNGSQLCSHGDDNHLQSAQDLIAAVAAPVIDAVSTIPVVGALGKRAVTDQLDQGDTTPEAAAGNDASTNRDLQALPSLPAQCHGNGTDGARLQVVVVDAADRDVAAAADVDVRRWVGQADWTYAASALADGANRRLRLVTAPSGDSCKLDIDRVTLTAAEADGYQSTWNALAARGYDRTDRKYVVFVNTNDYCGIGTVTIDDRATATNSANNTVGYAQVNAPCWTQGDLGFYSVMAHEITHNLGGIQASATNSTNGYHCTDEWDVMCYADADQKMTIACEDDDDNTTAEADTFNRLLDCGSNDYFNASTNVTGYLANHWNVANSLFLAGRPAPANDQATTDQPTNDQPTNDQPQDTQDNEADTDNERDTDTQTKNDGEGDTALATITSNTNFIVDFIISLLDLLNPSAA